MTHKRINDKPTMLSYQGEITQVRYNIDRFGRLYGYVAEFFSDDKRDVQTAAADYFQIDDRIEEETIYKLLTLQRGNHVTLQLPQLGNTLGSSYYPVDNTLDSTGEIPNCIYCERPLSVSLGNVCCPNVLCAGRLSERIEHFIIEGNVPVDTGQLDMIHEYIRRAPDVVMYPKAMVDFIFPDAEIVGYGHLYDDRTQDYLSRYYKSIARDLVYYPGVDSYLSSIMAFIMNLSIPGILPEDIFEISRELAAVGDNAGLITSVGQFIYKKDPSYYKIFSDELGEISSRIHMYGRY